MLNAIAVRDVGLRRVFRVAGVVRVGAYRPRAVFLSFHAIADRCSNSDRQPVQVDGAVAGVAVRPDAGAGVSIAAVFDGSLMLSALRAITM